MINFGGDYYYVIIRATCGPAWNIVLQNELFHKTNFSQEPPSLLFIIREINTGLFFFTEIK